ncbi:MAG: metallophosphoesterase family protein [Gammaproteobacteria bacterium]|nr:metallophosphoesterase family protein [Gammaproteobacteria bacterium]
MKILVISDVHGNAEALSAVLDQERDMDTTVFLGDSILPGPQPNETMALLQGLPGIAIMGNHDAEMLKPERVTALPGHWRALYEWTFDVFDPAGFEYLRNLRPGGDYEVNGIRMCLRHGNLPGALRRALPDSPDEALVQLADGSDCPYVLFGHSHVQFRRTLEGREFINPGSVGQNRCGNLLACYGVFEDGVFHHRQVEFDPNPWLDALDRVTALDAHPDFREWLKQGLLRGYGVGEREPWTRYAREGYF